MLPGVLGDDLGAEGAIQVDVLTGKLADVVMKEAWRLADKNEIVTGVAMHFHGT